MSAILYGRIVRWHAATGKSLQGGDNIAKKIAALVPVDVIAVHGFILGLATTTTGDTTTITNPGLLKGSLIPLLGLTFALYCIGRGKPDLAGGWIPVVAFLCWTAIIGTSALTPWITDFGVDAAIVSVAAAFIGVILVAITPKDP